MKRQTDNYKLPAALSSFFTINISTMKTTYRAEDIVVAADSLLQVDNSIEGMDQEQTIGCLVGAQVVAQGVCGRLEKRKQYVMMEQ